MVRTRSDVDFNNDEAENTNIDQLLDEKLSAVASKTDIQDLKNLILEQNKTIDEQNKKIKSLSDTVSTQERKINILGDRLAVISSALEHLKVNADNQEQYSRRTCLRINGIKAEKNETAEKCLEKVKKVCQDLKVNIPDECFDRAHRIGKDKKCMIVKFTSFRYRTLLYRNRNKDGPVKIHLDLTKHRLNLLDKAKELMTENCGVNFVFADVNCNTVARMVDGSYKFFNTLEEFTNVLRND